MKLFVVITLAYLFITSGTVLSEITLDNAQSIVEIGRIAFPEAEIWDMAFQPNDSTVAVILLNGSIANNGEVVLLDRVSLEAIIIPDQVLLATALAFSPDGTLLAIGNAQGQITVYATNSYEQLWSFTTSPDIVNDLAISPDNRFLGATFANPIFEVRGEHAFQLLTLPAGEIAFSEPLEDQLYGIYGGGVAFDTSGESVFYSTTNTTSDNGLVSVWDISSEEAHTLHDGYTMSSGGLVFSALDEGVLFIGDNGIHFVDASGETEIQIGFESQEEILTGVATHPTEHLLAVAYQITLQNERGGPSLTDAGKIRLFSMQSSEELVVIDVPEGAIRKVAFSPDGRMLASGGKDGTIRLWGVPAGGE